jgi:predicted amidohydrolase
MIDQIRVAAGQFAATTDLTENLASCLRLIDEAAANDAGLIVLPEFANHLSVYESLDHCRRVAVELDGDWMSMISQRARALEIGVSLAVTIPRDDRVTITNVLFDAAGEIIATADKQTLMGNERTYLTGGTSGSALADTRYGPVGIYACMDGVTFETPRTFAVRGARLLLNSLNSFALDEAALHIPVRAVENGVFVVAANKVGPLLPAEQVEAFSQALGIPPHVLQGAGESQIVAPDGEVLASASRTEEELIVADIDLAEVRPLNDRFGHRRPEIYGPLAKPHSAVPRDDVPEIVEVRCVRHQPCEAEEAQLVVLPEGTVPPAAIPYGVWVATSAVVDQRHVGQLWTADGLRHEQAQLHHSERFDATEFGDELTLCETPFGDIALIIGDDHLYPEVVRLAAVQGAHIAVVLYHPTSSWHTDLSLRERAAENRLCLVACTSLGVGGTMVLNPPRDSLWSTDRLHPYNGTINTPDAVVAGPDDPILQSRLYPTRALQREISRNTDLVGGRSWQASAALL